MGLPVERKNLKGHSSTYEMCTFYSTSIMLGILLCWTGGEVFSSSLKLLDERCLNCFCQALTGCNYSYGCRTEERIMCGPYRLTRAYWRDGGKPGSRNGQTNQEDYEDYVACTQNASCAEETIQKYNDLYYKDCNGNGKIDCVDYFRTHLAGPHLCNDNTLEKTIDWLKFLECYLNTAKSTEAALRSIRSG